MLKEEIEKLIDDKVLKAKLEIAEKRLNHLKWFFGFLFVIFGAVLPIWQTTISTQKVDKAILEMKQDFDKLAGKQIGKPILECYYDGSPLENNVIKYETNVKNNYRNQWTPIEFRNNGSSTAKIKRMLLYLNFENVNDLTENHLSELRDLTHIDIKDEPKYNFVVESYVQDDFELHPKEAYPIDFQFPYFRNLEPLKSDALLKIYYGQPEPLRVNFYLEEKRIEKEKK